MDHFYITLPSNSSEDVYGKQSLCSFKTHLAKPLHLDVSEWEVGLAEIIYPHTWKNVKNGKFCLKYLENSNWVWHETEIPSAMYESPEVLIRALNEKLNDVLPKEQQGKIAFHYNSVERKFLAFVDRDGYMVRFSKSMAMTLGLGDKETTLRQTKEESHGITTNENRIVYNNDKIIGQYAMDLNRGLHTFFVYCDIVQYQLVGDANVPLLRTVAVSGRNGDVVAKSFDNIHYVGLSRSTFQEVHIHITDDTGLKVPFEHGRVIVKLHFRRK